MIYAAVMGYGVVGSGTVEVFYKNRDSVVKKAGQEMDIKKILDLRDFPDSPYRDKLTASFDDIINDSEISVVVEVMGGLRPAYDYVKRCLEAGKSVVTSNKELVAEKGAELLAVARAHNVSFLFEASVGGGIPIIRPLYHCLAANDIDEIAGILNGTTNFILNKMIKDQMDFEDALSLAQRLGYAERDPAADVEGHDASRKVCILASLAFGTHVYPDQVPTKGITEITLEDVEYASNAGYALKLIGHIKKLEGNKIAARVCPMFIPRESQLASIDDVFNGILVRGDATGDVVFYGRGAGKLPTASAVVADMIDVVRHMDTQSELFWEDGGDDYVIGFAQIETAFYVRAAVDSGDAAARVRRVFPDVKLLNKLSAVADGFAFITEKLPEEQFYAKLADCGIAAQAVIPVFE